MILRYVVAAEPGPYLGDVATAPLHPGERGVKAPVRRPAGGDVRGDFSQGGERGFLIPLAAWLRQPQYWMRASVPPGTSTSAAFCQLTSGSIQ